MLHIFYHTDLDGIGVKILGVIFAKLNKIPYTTHCCGYSKINREVTQCLQENPEGIFIGDLSVSEETAELLEQAYQKGLKVSLFDHHDPALWLNKYEWATVKTNYYGKPCCGASLMAEDRRFARIKRHLAYFIEQVTEWDTWNWKYHDNQIAYQLNALFAILGDEDFTSYILNQVFPDGSHHFGYITDENSLLSKDAKIMSDTHQRLAEQLANSCEKYMYTMNLWVPTDDKEIKLKTGVVFLNSSLSIVGDKILDKHPELDVLMMIVFPGNISWRSHKDLPISLSKVAKSATGRGGGHANASGSLIPFSVFQDIFCGFLDRCFQDKLDYSHFTSAFERRERERMAKYTS